MTDGIEMDGAQGITLEPTMELRFVVRFENIERIARFGDPVTIGHKPVKVLQQAWRCLEDGSIHWRDVPTEGETQ